MTRRRRSNCEATRWHRGCTVPRWPATRGAANLRSLTVTMAALAGCSGLPEPPCDEEAVPGVCLGSTRNTRRWSRLGAPPRPAQPRAVRYALEQSASWCGRGRRRPRRRGRRVLERGDVLWVAVTPSTPAMARRDDTRRTPPVAGPGPWNSVSMSSEELRELVARPPRAEVMSAGVTGKSEARRGYRLP